MARKSLESICIDRYQTISILHQEYAKDVDLAILVQAFLELF